MFELSNSFIGMLKYFSKILTITSDPFRSPGYLHHLKPANQVPMNIPKMERICSIFRNILHDTFDFMNSVSSIGIIFTKLSTIYHVEIRFYFWISMNPNINENIYLFYGIFS